MLVSKFLQKNQLQPVGPINNQTREAEVRIHAVVIREFEKFISEQTFTQNKLAAFEVTLKKKMDEMLQGTCSLKRVENRVPTDRYNNAVANNVAMRSQRNNTAVPKG
jgi:hypothetical protein